MDTRKNDVLDRSSSDDEKATPATNSHAQINTTLEFSVTDLQKLVHLDYDPNLDEDPIKAAERTGPRTYTLKNHQNDDVRFFVFGCHGDKKIKQQREVADYIEKIKLEHPELMPDFIILLGDNFYPNGVGSYIDHRFQTQFYDMYKIPCFVLPGNHDRNQHKADKKVKDNLYWTGLDRLITVRDVGRARAIFQVAHSYTKHKPDPELPTHKAEFYRQPELDFKLLPKFNQPWFYYSVIIGNSQLFFLDSSALGDDYLTLVESKNPDNIKAIDNEAVFLRDEFKKCLDAKRTPLIFQHHPLTTSGSRGRYGWGDALCYFPSEERWQKAAALFGLDKADYQYNALLAKIFDVLGVRIVYYSAPDKEFKTRYPTIFNAHDHCITNHISPELRQFTCGGGGGDLQERYCFDKHENMGFYWEKHGFYSVMYNKKNPSILNVHAFATDGAHLLLTDASPRPITVCTDSNIGDLYQLVLHACSLYADTLDKSVKEEDKKVKKTNENQFTLVAVVTNYFAGSVLYDIKGMHNIITYFSQPSLDDFQTVLEQLNVLMDSLTIKTNDTSSLYGKINHVLKYGSIDSTTGRVIIDSEKQARFGKSVTELLDINVTEPTPSMTSSLSH